MGRLGRLTSTLARWWGVGLLVLIFLASIATSTGLRLDEPGHAAFTLYLAGHPIWTSIQTYQGAQNFEAKGPFFFLLGAAWGSVFGMTLANLRLLSMLFGILALASSAKLIESVSRQGRLAGTTSLVVLPYFLYLSLTYHTDVATLALVLVSVFGYCRNVERARPLSLVGAVAAASCMLWIRIDSALALAAVAAARLLDGPIPRRVEEIRPWLSRIPARLWVGLTLPLLFLLPLLWAWGGLLPPTAAGRPVPLLLQLAPSNATFGLCVAGLYFAPFALRGMDRTRSAWVAAAAGLALFVAFPVSFEPGVRDRFLGLIRSVLVASLPGSLRPVVLAVLAVSGALAVWEILRANRGQGPTSDALSAFVVVSLLAQAIRGPVMYERYLLPMNAALMILALGGGAAGWWRRPWLVGLLALSLTHLVRNRLVLPP